MNKRYLDLKVTQDTYVPPVTTDFPEDDPYVGLYKPVYDRPFRPIDADFPYVDNSLKYRFRIWYAYHFVLRILALYLRIKYGLRVKGKQYLRKYKKELKGGAISISNHCYRHDCASVLIALHAFSHQTRIPMFAPNFQTKDQYFLGIVGGIPIPSFEAGLSAMKAFNAAFDEFHKRGYWLHIFPEAKRWDWYKPLRPFQKGAFTMAYKYKMPIIPCAITYRPRTGIFKCFGKQEEPLIQVNIGEPIFIDHSLQRAEAIENLRYTTHNAICQLAGILHNTWPVKPNTE